MAAQEAVGLGSRVDQRVRLGEVIVSAQSMHPLSRGFPLVVPNSTICWHFCKSARVTVAM